MKNTNLWIGVGRIGQDLELKRTKNGQSQVMFSIAVNEDYIDQNGNEVKQVNWIPCVAYGKQAENLANFKKKGELILVKGAITVRDGIDKDGNKRTFTNIRVENTEWFGNKSDGSIVVPQAVQDNEPRPFDDGYVPYAALDEDIF